MPAAAIEDVVVEVAVDAGSRVVGRIVGQRPIERARVAAVAPITGFPGRLDRIRRPRFTGFGAIARRRGVAGLEKRVLLQLLVDICRKFEA